MNDDIMAGDLELYPEGIPRQCKHCGTWSRHKKPKRCCKCFSVSCPSCHKDFEVVVNMKGGRR